MKIFFLLTAMIALITLTGCPSKNQQPKDEQLSVSAIVTDTLNAEKTDTSKNAIRGDMTLADLATFPSRVVLTGLAPHRLVTVYKSLFTKDARGVYKSYSYSDYGYESDTYEHYMPGLDLIYGYNLVNVQHYDLGTDERNFIFNHPVLVKSLYYPSYEQDSLNKKPINRNFYLISAYDEDTNLDTLINKNDLRRFYRFNALGNEKIQIIPPDYSVERSEYDAMNDVMYIFARHDANHDGKADKKEAVHIFWMSLKNPGPAKKVY
jgi:hypothetical protein